MSLTKAELTEALSIKMKLSKHDAKGFVDCFFDEIIEFLAKGNPLTISGLGTFELRDKTSRPGRNPKTGQDVTIGARRVVTFKQGQKLKDLLNSGA